MAWQVNKHRNPLTGQTIAGSAPERRLSITGSILPVGWNRRRSMCLLVLLLVAGQSGAQTPDPRFELVESIPVETALDNPLIRNTTEVWLELIRAARKTIDIEQFYVANQPGEALETIIRELEQANRRGVTIRLIADARMAQTYPETLDRLSRQPLIDVHKTPFFNRRGGVQHAKLLIVDRQTVFIGSPNFDWRALDHIHEIGLKIIHPELAQLLTAMFEADWNQSYPATRTAAEASGQWFKMQLTGGETVRFYLTGSPADLLPAGMRWDETAIVELIDSAKQQISIQLLSYSPLQRKTYYARLDQALRRAATRGVSVHLLVSDWCQRPDEIPYLKSLAVWPGISVKLSTIPQWSGGYISYSRVEHCKYMIVDDQMVWLGTSNWKRDYFYDSRNVALVVQSHTLNQLLRQVFAKSWDGEYSWLVRPEATYTPKFYGENP